MTSVWPPSKESKEPSTSKSEITEPAFFATGATAGTPLITSSIWKSKVCPKDVPQSPHQSGLPASMKNTRRSKDPVPSKG